MPSARPTSSRRWSPYARFFANSSSLPARPTYARSSFERSRVDTSSRRSRGVWRIASNGLAFMRVCRPTMTFSSAVMFWNSRMFWNVRAMPAEVMRCGGWFEICRPSKRILPLVGR